MPRQKSLVTAIREIVQQQVRDTIQGLLATANPKRRRYRKSKNGRRRRRRREPGRPPGSKTRRA
jgi:hypothetical protein